MPEMYVDVSIIRYDNIYNIYLRCDPSWMIHFAFLLETELSVSHVDSGYQLIIRHAVDLRRNIKNVGYWGLLRLP